MQKFRIDMDIRRSCCLIGSKCGLNEECLHKRYLTKYCGIQRAVKSIGLFGSYAKGAPIEASDVDVVVEFARPICLRFIEFTEYLEERSGKRADVESNR